MKCPECGHEAMAGDVFCSRCGTKLENVCPNCGSKLREGDLFCSRCGTEVGATDASAAQAVEEAVPKLEDMQDRLYIPEPLRQRMDAAREEMEGENRLVTALFADISGFTPMSQEMSPEATVERVNQCFQVITDAVYRYEGSINRFIGDCVLGFFGAPLVHENDHERAILAALDMREAVSQIGLNISIGINTGMTYFGPIGTQQHLEVSAYGHDVNLAKRLQEAAAPGQVLAGAGTYRLTRRAFDFNRLDAVTLRGIGSPVPVYEVLSVKEHPEKLRGIEGLRARMIGREHEFAELKEATDAWLQGEGQIVSIIGEAGIGKSRLVRELREYLDMRLETPDMGQESLKSHVSSLMSILEGRCVSIGQPISYWPFLDILRAYFGLSEEDDPATKARKVTDATVHLFADRAEEVLPFLGHLLSIRFGNELDDRLKFATPDQIRHQTLMRLRDFFETVAQTSPPVELTKKRPLMLVLEDLHWADDLSLDLLSLLMDSLAMAPLMLLCVYRPERQHRVWQLSTQARRKCLERYTEITLNALSSRESRQLVETLLTIENLPESVKEMILQKSEGNPFFIEEVIRSLIERDLVYREDDRWKARAEISDMDVPDTIQSVLLARVGRLQAEAKYVLQCASVIGRLFKYRLLEYLAEHERNLDQYLSEFEERELVYEERTVPELEYAFKHALTQEATYQSILERRRKEFHHQVAVGIERLYQERLEEYYDELAHHYSMSEDAEKAMEYLLKAGEKAKRSYANEVAISHFQKALEMIERGDMERDDWKLEALRGLGEVHLGIGKIAESVEVFEKAIALAKEMELPPRQLVMLYHWISAALFWQSRFDEMIRYGEVGLEILGDDTECLEAALMNSRIAVGNSNKGNSEKWREYTHKNMAFIKKLPYSVELMPPYIHVVEVLAYQDRDQEAAWEWSKELEARAGEHRDLTALAEVWYYQAGIFKNKGNHKCALSSCQKSLDMCERIGDDKHASWCYGNIAGMLLIPRDIAWAHELSGDIAMCQHRWDEAISHYQKSLEGRQSIGRPSDIAQAYLQLGRAYLGKGDCRRVIQSLEEVADESVKAQGRLSRILGGMEEAYMVWGTPEKFVEFCRSFRDRHADAVEKLSFCQWYLEPAEPSKEFPHLDFADDFETETVDPSWDWIDEFGDCAVAQHSMLAENQDGILGYPSSHGLEICAANGRDLDGLNVSAPRLMREISGDSAVEVCVSPAPGNELAARSTEKPQMGGLLVWKDRDNFLRFEIGAHGPREVRLHGYVDGKHQVAGRGLLSGGGDGEVYLRLERAGDQFSAYCSVDGENWLTCGKLALPLDDPVQIGIHAIGMIDRTIYCGSFKEGTATLFRGFRLRTR
jgi:class 3 adenylate cyclase/tetratricopeptide (TPR) repeat protein